MKFVCIHADRFCQVDATLFLDAGDDIHQWVIDPDVSCQIFPFSMGEFKLAEQVEVGMVGNGAFSLRVDLELNGIGFCCTSSIDDFPGNSGRWTLLRHSPWCL